ncbi:iron-containing alcohol dehydrogenase family protein [uncultured Megasphaera sp.]|uniref:iron-containing alcohol dehydrogenase family protein n=1 Tax=uncultured Megasphaera sp. TaxID=165188 RepID=UPI0028041C68|nr:iron-containing alcohol dehydrogenase family protein [uncultured Megasphaera sp.]
MFTYFMPTKVFFGKGCIAQSGDVLANLGRKALLVTGRHSAKANGSQAAVVEKLDELGIAWFLFDEVENNPSIATIRKAAAFALEKDVDFVIGIGGGSPMDAAKAIALVCTNDLDDAQLFTGPYCKPLPIVAVPTTSGTGSEVTKVSVLTNPHAGTKQSINTPLIFPVYAFADPAFTESVPERVTVDTAIDALSHAIEGYMANTSTPMSDVWAEEAMRFLGVHLTDLKGDVPYVVREDLLYGSTLAGITIAQTGTTMVHSMGYMLTYYKGLSHGRANGLLLPAYMKLMEETMPDKTEKVWALLGVAGLDDFTALMQDLMGDKVDLSDEEIKKFVTMTMPTNGVKKTPYPVTADLMAKIYKEL